MARHKLQLQYTSNATEPLALSPGMSQVGIGAILLRQDGNIRQLAALHVVDLAESIAILGLLEPVVIDTTGRLLAGGHRLAALQLLAEPTPENRRAALLARCGWAPTDKEPKPKDELVSCS